MRKKKYSRPTSELISKSLYMGDNSKVDITVGDIYGPEGLPSLGLPAKLMASCMSKRNQTGDESKFDYQKSMATMYCVNLAHLGSLLCLINKVKSVLVLPSQYDSDHLKLKICITLSFYTSKRTKSMGDDCSIIPHVYFVDDQAILANLGIHLKHLKKNVD